MSSHTSEQAIISLYLKFLNWRVCWISDHTVDTSPLLNVECPSGASSSGYGRPEFSALQIAL